MAKTILSWKEPKGTSGGQSAQKSVPWENPKATRREIQTAYERYVLGVDAFPHIKFDGLDSEEEVARFPHKTQPAVRALARAWSLINEDEAWWNDSLILLGSQVQTRVQEGTFDAPISSIVRVGLNTVRVGILYPAEEDRENPVFIVKSYRSPEFMERFEGKTLNFSGGRSVTIENGRTHMYGGSPDVAIARGSNVAVLYGSDPAGEPETEAIGV